MKKIISAPFLEIKKYMPNMLKSIDNYWNNPFFTSGSGYSFKLIFSAFMEIKKVNTVKVLLPDYFCAETIGEFSFEGIHIVYYPVTRELEPDWTYLKTIEEQIDFFVFVHYFGELRNVEKAANYCRGKNILLIEDCAHLINKNNKIGKKSDFVLYSPHKFLPIPDGGIIEYNDKSEMANGIAQILRKKTESRYKSFFSTCKWIIKKSIQRITRVSFNTNVDDSPHFQEKAYLPQERQSISKWSHRYLLSLSTEDYNRVSYKRVYNHKLMDYYVNSVDEKIVPVTNADCGGIFAVYSLENVENFSGIVKKLKDDKIQVTYWPSLSQDIADDETFVNARVMSQKYIVLPIQQSIRFSEIAKRVHGNCSTRPLLNVLEVGGKEADKVVWNDVMCRAKLTNITQDWNYGEIKSNSQSWLIHRYVIRRNNNTIGAVQVLVKKLCGVNVLARVNKGPIFVKGEQSIVNEIEAIETIRRNYYRHTTFLWVPFSPNTVENYTEVVKAHWNNWQEFGFPSGTVDLSVGEEKMRASLESKWRNQLKKAESYRLNIFSDSSRLPEMLKLYEDEQRVKGFAGVESTLLLEMTKESYDALKLFYVVDEDDSILAFDIFYQHINCATYYIGWNSRVGRNMNLNNLLLYVAACYFQKEGFAMFDLGGIDYILTEQIANFKSGMRPQLYTHIGELIKVGTKR